MSINMQEVIDSIKQVREGAVESRKLFAKALGFDDEHINLETVFVVHTEDARDIDLPFVKKSDFVERGSVIMIKSPQDAALMGCV